jgi:hypothetical protein
VTVGLEIRSAATKPVPPTAEFCEHYFDEVVPAQPFDLKINDASTVMRVSNPCVDYHGLLYDILTTVAVCAPTVLSVAHDVLFSVRRVRMLVSSTQSTTDPASYTSMLDSIFGKPTTDFFKGYEQYNQRNWDGYDAEPITSKTLSYARRVLTVMPDTFGPPDIAPSGDGFIGLEWVPDDGPLDRLFLDIGPGEEWSAYWKLRNGAFGRLHGTGFDSQTKQHLQNLFADLSGSPYVTVGR